MYGLYYVQNELSEYFVGMKITKLVRLKADEIPQLCLLFYVQDVLPIFFNLSHNFRKCNFFYQNIVFLLEEGKTIALK